MKKVARIKLLFLILVQDREKDGRKEEEVNLLSIVTIYFSLHAMKYNFYYRISQLFGVVVSFSNQLQREKSRRAGELRY